MKSPGQEGLAEIHGGCWGRPGSAGRKEGGDRPRGRGGGRERTGPAGASVGSSQARVLGLGVQREQDSCLGLIPGVRGTHWKEGEGREKGSHTLLSRKGEQMRGTERWGLFQTSRSQRLPLGLRRTLRAQRGREGQLPGAEQGAQCGRKASTGGGPEVRERPSLPWCRSGA